MDGLRRLMSLPVRHIPLPQPLCTGITVLFLLLWVPVFHDIAGCSSPVATSAPGSTLPNEACGQCHHLVPPVSSPTLGWHPALITEVAEPLLSTHAFRVAPLLRPPQLAVSSAML